MTAMTAKRKLVTFKTEEKLWKDFKTVCGKTTATDAFINFMMRCIEQGELPTETTATDKQQAALEQRIAVLEALVTQCQEQLSALNEKVNQWEGQSSSSSK